MTTMTREQMEKLPTKRLVAFRRKYWKLPPSWCDCGTCFNCRQDKDVESQLNMAKEVLDTREHVERDSA